MSGHCLRNCIPGLPLHSPVHHYEFRSMRSNFFTDNLDSLVQKWVFFCLFQVRCSQPGELDYATLSIDPPSIALVSTQDLVVCWLTQECHKHHQQGPPSLLQIHWLFAVPILLADFAVKLAAVVQIESAEFYPSG